MKHRFLVSELRWLAHDPLGQPVDGRPTTERSALVKLVLEILGDRAASENSGERVCETASRSAVEPQLAETRQLFAVNCDNK